MPAPPPAHPQHGTQTFIIYKNNGELWYIDTEVGKVERIDIRSRNQPWVRVPRANGTLPKATITVLIRSEEPVYIKTVDEKKNEENFRKTYNTSFIRTFTKDQLFEVETNSNLKQKILIKNLKTDKYRRKRGTHIIYNKIEGPYMFYVYSLTLDGIERKYYLFGEAHRNPLGHCGVPPSPRFFQLIQKLMKESPSFFDLFFEQGLSKDLAGNFFKWDPHEFLILVSRSIQPTIKDKITDAYNQSFFHQDILEPELLEISNSIRNCRGDPDHQDCNLIRAHYIDNRLVYTQPNNKYNTLLFWLFSNKLTTGTTAVMYQLIYEGFRFIDFFNYLFEYIPVAGNHSQAQYHPTYNAGGASYTRILYVPGSDFTRSLVAGDEIIIYADIKYRGRVLQIFTDDTVQLDSLYSTTRSGYPYPGYPIIELEPSYLLPLGTPLAGVIAPISGNISSIKKLNRTISGQKLYNCIIYQNIILNNELNKCDFKNEIENFFVRELDSYIAAVGGTDSMYTILYTFFSYMEQFSESIGGRVAPPSQYVAGDLVERNIRLAEQFLLKVSIIDMDIYLLARLFATTRTREPKKCYNSITYSGSHHTENYKKFFDYLIAQGVVGVMRAGIIDNTAISCVDISGFARTDDDLF